VIAVSHDLVFLPALDLHSRLLHQLSGRYVEGGNQIGAAGNAQQSTHQVNKPGLHMLGYKQVFHLVSLEKKTVGFFKMSFSIFSRRFSSFS
jgi:hypothetical protein